MSVLTGQLDPMSPDVRIRNVERKCRERPTDKCIEEKLKMIVKGRLLRKLLNKNALKKGKCKLWRKKY